MEILNFFFHSFKLMRPVTSGCNCGSTNGDYWRITRTQNELNRVLPALEDPHSSPAILPPEPFRSHRFAYSGIHRTSGGIRRNPRRSEPHSPIYSKRQGTAARELSAHSDALLYGFGAIASAARQASWVTIWWKGAHCW